MNHHSEENYKVLPQPSLAVSYLRVSSKRQLDTAIDIDADGNSIATQRETVGRKAAAMGATIVREFLEPGMSAQTINKRIVFQELMQYLREHPEVDSVLIYMRSRAFRNLADAVNTKRRFQEMDVKLVSAKEDFGEGIWADAMEAVTDIMNEVQVRMSGEDIRIKMQHKAERGGTLGKAKLGYLNVRAEIEGRLVNTIAVDEERAPLIRKGWELYATGEYSLDHLSATISDLGLTTRPTYRTAAAPVSAKRWSEILRDPYYAGHVVYKGQIYAGRHEPIITQAVYDRVQEVLDARSQRGQRDRILYHYLKGMLFCQRCRKAGRESRLIYTEATGRNGQRYGYFLCRGRQSGVCDLPHLASEQIERAILNHYIGLRMPAGVAAQARIEIDRAIADHDETLLMLRAQLTKQLKEIAARENRLLNMVEAGALSTQAVAERGRALTLERTRVEQSLAEAVEDLALGAEALRSFLELLERPQELYRQAPAGVRRQLNQTFFERFYIEDHGYVGDEASPMMRHVQQAFSTWDTVRLAGEEALLGVGITPTDETVGHEWGSASWLRAMWETEEESLVHTARVGVSSKTFLVGPAGFEPATAAV